MSRRNSVNRREVTDLLKQEGMYIIETREDVERMLDVMARFYADDALFDWLCDGEYDEMTAKYLMSAGIYSMPAVISYADSPEFNAVAAWVPPGNKVLSPIPYLTNGGLDLYKQRGVRIMSKLLNYQGIATRMHKSITGKGDWYLFSYAVNPDCDEYEFSGKILRPITKYGWERGEACYCEVTSDRGINIMRAAGFQVRDQIRIPRSRVIYYGVMV